MISEFIQFDTLNDFYVSVYFDCANIVYFNLICSASGIDLYQQLILEIKILEFKDACYAKYVVIMGLLSPHEPLTHKDVHHYNISYIIAHTSSIYFIISDIQSLNCY